MARKRKKGVIRQTFELLRDATTPAVIVRSLKTARQTTAGGTAGTGTITAVQQFVDASATQAQALSTGRYGLLVTLLSAVYAFGWSLWENVTSAAEQMVSDSPPVPPASPQSESIALFPPDSA